MGPAADTDKTVGGGPCENCMQPQHTRQVLADPDTQSILVSNVESTPSLKELAGLLDCILLDARNAGHEDVSLSGEHVLKAVAKLVEERHHVAAKEHNCECDA